LVKLRIAVATEGKDGLRDRVSSVFGRAATFTLIDVDGEAVAGVKVLENPVVSYHHGAGPIVVKMLVDEGVNVVISNELGLGASELLKQQNVKSVFVKPGTSVESALKRVLRVRRLPKRPV